MFIEAIECEIPEKIPLHKLVDPGASPRAESERVLTLAYANVRAEIGKETTDVKLTDAIRDKFKICGVSPEQPFSNKHESGEFAALTGMQTVSVSKEKTATEMVQDTVAKTQQNAMISGSWKEPSFVIYCHSVPEDSYFVTPAMGVQYISGNADTIPFSLSECDTVAAFHGLALAKDLIGDDPEASVILVTADRYFTPIPRRIGNFTMMSDAVTASYLAKEMDANGEGLCIDCVQIRPLDDLINVFGADDAVLETWTTRLKDELISLVLETLEKCALTSADIDYVVPHVVNRPFVDAVHQSLDLKNATSLSGLTGETHNYSTSSPLIGLMQLPARSTRARSTRKREIILLWGIGLNGSVACAIMSR